MYKNKYLKYKSKYLKYKNQLGGVIKKKTNERCNNCYCQEEYIEDDNIMNEIIVLDCGCCIHRTCLIKYIRYFGIERGFDKKLGIKCPNASDFSDTCKNPLKLITPDDIDTYLDHSMNRNADVYEEGTPMRQFDLDNTEINKFRESRESSYNFLKFLIFSFI